MPCNVMLFFMSIFELVLFMMYACILLISVCYYCNITVAYSYCVIVDHCLLLGWVAFCRKCPVQTKLPYPVQTFATLVTTNDIMYHKFIIPDAFPVCLQSCDNLV